jgi:hypothetical protein
MRCSRVGANLLYNREILKAEGPAMFAGAKCYAGLRELRAIQEGDIHHISSTERDSKQTRQRDAGRHYRSVVPPPATHMHMGVI